MRMFAQDRAFYGRIRVDGTEHPEALRRLELLERVSLARRRGWASRTRWRWLSCPGALITTGAAATGATA